MNSHDSARWDPSKAGYQQDFGDYVGSPPEDLSHEPEDDQPVQVFDSQVMRWSEQTGPLLTPTHDAIRNALCSFISTEGGWIPLTQQRIADAAHLSRQVINRLLPDLIDVGLFQKSEPLTDGYGRRECAYRCTGEDTGWVPTPVGPEGRQTVKDFQMRQRIAELETLASKLYAHATNLDDSLIATADRLLNNPDKKSSTLLAAAGITGQNPDSYWAVNENGLQPTDVYTPTRVIDREGHRIPGGREQASESQMMKIAIEMDRTGLDESDVLARWAEVHPNSPVPDAVEAHLLLKSRANRVIRWFHRQPSLAVAEPEPERQDVPAESSVCTCESQVEIDPQAQSTWQDALGRLEMELPRTTFDTWLKETEGLAFEGMDLLVQVPSVFTIAWLEQRMYQTILRALRQSSGELLDVRFQADSSCRIHPSGGEGQSHPPEGRYEM